MNGRVFDLGGQAAYHLRRQQVLEVDPYDYAKSLQVGRQADKLMDDLKLAEASQATQRLQARQEAALQMARGMVLTLTAVAMSGIIDSVDRKVSRLVPIGEYGQVMCRQVGYLDVTASASRLGYPAAEVSDVQASRIQSVIVAPRYLDKQPSDADRNIPIDAVPQSELYFVPDALEEISVPPTLKQKSHVERIEAAVADMQAMFDGTQGLLAVAMKMGHLRRFQSL